MRIRSVLSVVLATVAVLGLVTANADAGPNGIDENTVVVEKVVEGPVPPGSVFEVLLTCTPLQGASPGAETIAPVTFSFDENGDPIGDNSVGVGLFEECTVVETVTNGATVSYACEMAFPIDRSPEPEGNGGIVQAECTGDQTAVFYEVVGAVATFTVTNTFEELPPPDVDPDDVLPDVDDDVVAATPSFTG